jgi:MFS transporter, DHA1 family, multidrug resistance protein
MARSTPQQTLQRLRIIVAIQFMGATLGLPLLPLFLEHRGGNPTIIGLIMASFFFAGVISQYFFGHLADKFGRRPILVVSLLIYAVASGFYIVPMHAGWFILARMFQGAAAGAFEVASLSAVAARFPEETRGRAMSQVIAAQLLGIAIGPMLGAVVNVSQLGWAFFATGVVSLVAALVTFSVDLGDRAFDPTPLPPLQWNPQLLGALGAACAAGISIGVYETCWSLLMHSHHASTFQIRLSWTVFCLPWVLLSPVGGYIADHWNRRWVSTLGVLGGAAFMATYPHIHNNVVMLITGSFESIFSALSVPSISSYLTQGADNREMGRRQGLYTTANTASLAVAATIAGTLYSQSPILPFTIAALSASALGIASFVTWRRVPGRVTTQISS